MSILIGINIGLFILNIVMGIIQSNLPSVMGWLCALIWIGLYADK